MGRRQHRVGHVRRQHRLGHLRQYRLGYVRRRHLLTTRDRPTTSSGGPASPEVSTIAMERMPFQPELDTNVHVSAAVLPPPGGLASWRLGLPVLRGALVSLRELRLSDAGPLLAAM